MAKMDLRQFISSDIGAYGIGLPLLGGGAAAALSAFGLNPVAAGAIGLFTGSTVIGLLRGVSGVEETRGMTTMELKTAAGISALVTALTWAADKFAGVKQASALIKAAEDAATTAASGAGNPVGGTAIGFLVFAISAFSMTLGSIAWGELISDWARGGR